MLSGWEMCREGVTCTCRHDDGSAVLEQGGGCRAGRGAVWAGLFVPPWRGHLAKALPTCPVSCLHHGEMQIKVQAFRPALR